MSRARGLCLLCTRRHRSSKSATNHWSLDDLSHDALYCYRPYKLHKWRANLGPQFCRQYCEIPEDTRVRIRKKGREPFTLFVKCGYQEAARSRPPGLGGRTPAPTNHKRGIPSVNYNILQTCRFQKANTVIFLDHISSSNTNKNNWWVMAILRFPNEHLKKEGHSRSCYVFLSHGNMAK